MTRQFDLVIAGGGAAGLSLALAVKSVAGKALSVALCDPDLAAPARGDSRAYAIVAGARRFFDSFGAWEAMAGAAEPMTGMEVTDSALEEIVRPLMMDFSTPADASEPFAHMLPNGVILAALRARAATLGLTLLPHPVTAARTDGPSIIATVDGQPLTARLVVAADGRASRLREAAGIPYYGWRYPQTAIVGTIDHTLPHNGIAVQHFLPSGPFAILPLQGNRSSIVWNEEPETASRLLKLAPDDLLAEVDRRAAGRFGTVTAFRDTAAFPMAIGIARRFSAGRLALLGDAAHGYHPIAGQGLNYGLRGAAALAEAILDSARLGLDIGAATTLETYEQARRPDVMAMAAATEALNRLFSNDIGPVRMLRDLGLGLVSRIPGAGARLMAEAAGNGALAPRSFRGQPL